MIGNLEPIIRNLDSVSQRDQDWLDIQLLLAKAYRIKAQKYEATGKKDSKTRSTIRNNNENAVKLARKIARVPGPTRAVARGLLEEWKIKVGDVVEVEKILTFSQARTQARDMMADVEDFRTTYLETKSRLTAAGDQADEELKQEFQDARSDLRDKCDEVHALLAKALSMVDDGTSRDELANVHYLRAYGYFASERYFETVVMAKYLIKRFPTSTSTRDTVALAVKSFLQLYQQAEQANADSQFEMDNLVDLANEMLKRWPGTRPARPRRPLS